METFEDSLDTGYADEVKYPTPQLEMVVQAMQIERETAGTHRQEFLYKALGYAGYELAMREQGL